MTYLEYSDYIVSTGKAPSALCYMDDFSKVMAKGWAKSNTSRFSKITMADRVFSIKDGMVIEAKNRFKEPSTFPIDPMDELALKLKAVYY